MVEELKVIADMLGGLQGDTLSGVYVYLGIVLTKFVLSLATGIYIVKLVVKLVKEAMHVDNNAKYRDIIKEAHNGAEVIKKWEACEEHRWAYPYSECSCDKCGAPSKMYRGH